VPRRKKTVAGSSLVGVRSERVREMVINVTKWHVSAERRLVGPAFLGVGSCVSWKSVVAVEYARVRNLFSASSWRRINRRDLFLQLLSIRTRKW
jgi:hypothetical protein